MSSRFAITLELRVTGPDRSGSFDEVIDCYAKLESGDERLLDCAWSFTDNQHHSYVTVELTIQADDEAAAYDLARGSVRAAIQDAGGYTPGWEDSAQDPEMVVYRLASEEAVPV